MNKSKRTALIEEITAHAPQEFDLPESTRRNLGELDDAELQTLHGKLQLVKEHIAGSGLTRQDVGERRADLAKRRSAIYERLASLKPRSASSEAEGVQATGAPTTATPARPAAPKASTNTDLVVALSLWNSYDRIRSPALTEQMRATVQHWLDDFAGSLGFTVAGAHLHGMLDGPLRPEFTHYLELAIDRAGRDTLRMLRNHLLHGAVKPATLMEEPVMQLILNGMIAREALETVFVVGPSGRLRETATIDGLAKMRTFALNYRPDLIVSASRGGKIVGDFIAREARMEAGSNRVMACRGRNATLSGGWRSLSGFKRILLVDDLAGGADTLCEAHRALVAHVGVGDVQMVAFASSLETREQLIEEGHSGVFVAVASDRTVDLPWDRGGTYAERPDSHVFGQGLGTKFSVNKAQIRRVSNSLMEATPASPLPA